MKVFEHPEVRKLFDELYTKLLEESGRGAILIATAYTEDYLTEIIQTVLPEEMSRDNKRKLLKGSFFSKLNSAYAYRLINKNLFDSINSLREVRNDAAHSPSKFELHELNEKMQFVYDLGPNIPVIIKNMATELLVGSKAISLNGLFNEQNLSQEEKKKELTELLEQEENKAILEKQLPYWELLTGICLICAMLIHKRDRLAELQQGISTWDNLLNVEE